MSRFAVVVLAFLVALGAKESARAEQPPDVIKIYGQGVGYGRPFGNQVVSVLAAKKFIEEEFKAENVRVEWTFPSGTGPAINEALANGRADFANYGGLPNIVGRAAGLKTKLLASYGVGNVYLAVRKDLPFQSIADLKGKRITVAKGTINQLSLNRFLASNGLSEKDVTLIDLKAADQLPALVSGDVDAAFAGLTLLALRDQGAVKIPFSSAGQISPANYFGAFTVTEDFAAKYPETTKRVVKAFVKAAHWASLEENRKELYDIWALNGTPRAAIEEDAAGLPLKDRHNPLFDEFTVDQYAKGIAFALDNKFIKQPIDLNRWIDRSYLNAAIKELKLEGFWSARDLTGRPRS